MQKDLTKPKRTYTILATSDKRQATSDKRQATSDKRQATSDKRQATSDKRQATSDKRQATSDKRQATSNKRHKRAVCPHKNTPATVQFFSKQPWFGKGGCVPLNPRLFVGGKRDTCQTQVSLFPPTAPYLLFNAAKGDTPLETPSVNRKAYKQRFPKSCGGMKIGHPVRFSTRVCSANSHTVGSDRTSCAVAIFQIFYRRNYYENM
ncbi:hypothetical protein HMPREF9353_00314 [Treponema denticola F0402]|nr:hypothetical protein HMPREF9353_00314 [Treponema denticola F0402]